MSFVEGRFRAIHSLDVRALISSLHGFNLQIEYPGYMRKLRVANARYISRQRQVALASFRRPKISSALHRRVSLDPLSVLVRNDHPRLRGATYIFRAGTDIRRFSGKSSAVSLPPYTHPVSRPMHLSQSWRPMYASCPNTTRSGPFQRRAQAMPFEWRALGAPFSSTERRFIM
jgi:hypothetical protein